MMKGTLKYIETGDEGIYQTIDEMIKLVIRDSQSNIVRNIAKDIAENNSDDLEKAIAVFEYVSDNIEYMFDHENVVEHLQKFTNQEAKAIKSRPQDTEFLVAPACLLGEDKNCDDIWEGDCDDMTMAVCALCATPEINLDCTMRIIDWKPDGRSGFTHVYPEIGLRKSRNKWLKNDVWIPADPVYGTFGGEKEPANSKTFRGQSFLVYTRKDK